MNRETGMMEKPLRVDTTIECTQGVVNLAARAAKPPWLP